MYSGNLWIFLLLLGIAELLAFGLNRSTSYAAEETQLSINSIKVPLVTQTIFGQRLRRNKSPAEFILVNHRVAVSARRGHKRFTEGRLTVDSDPVKQYYPETARLSDVCLGSTIPYGIPKVMKWIKQFNHNNELSARPFYIDLRRKIFDDGNSEECHKLSMTHWKAFQECQLRRNQRMEYNVPQYPHHQKQLT
ncbi:uncharacterized protein LOC108598666 [Drosophila busckii]|uniref:uncharacterized protein LOC108598666 n=1 Tax=Drosophila busckii TaxID=30019 RepID=UPI00083ED81C|nr:uncharacterized protein LOC108598666 [Drosophila busckii]